jgi:hypothetical protein
MELDRVCVAGLVALSDCDGVAVEVKDKVTGAVCEILPADDKLGRTEPLPVAVGLEVLVGVTLGVGPAVAAEASLSIPPVVPTYTSPWIPILGLPTRVTLAPVFGLADHSSVTAPAPFVATADTTPFCEGWRHIECCNSCQSLITCRREEIDSIVVG